MRDYSVKCCPQPYNISVNQNNCIRREIKNDYTKLCQLQNKTKPSNLCWLSDSKEIETIFQEKCNPVHQAKAKLKIIPDNKVNSRNDPFPVIKNRKLDEYKQLQAGKILKSLGNNEANLVQNAKVKEKTSKPKKTKKKIKLEKSRKSTKPQTELSQLTILKEAYIHKVQNRLKILSKPKKYPEYKPKRWILTKALKHYKATARLCELAKPKKYNDNDQHEDPFKVQANALSYQASLRIKELSKPNKNVIKMIEEDKKKNPFKVKPKALRAIATKRIKELATPKDYSNIHIRANPYKVSRLALKSKASTRVKQLAQPKTCTK